MCGIFGSICDSGVKVLKNRVSLETIKHRGPDQKGEFVDEKVYMGHNRLSILDLSENARQPMVSNEIAITINGEIYNFQELKTDLQRKKYSFKSNSDSEIILHGYLEWGIDGLLERIDGMYSIAIYDQKNKNIYLARDRYGIKPLYFAYLNKTFCWASELKAIHKYYCEDSLQIDYTAIFDYLTYLYVPTPKTLYININKLPPAHYLKFNIESSNYKINRYWELSCYEVPCTIKYAAEKINTLLQNSVKSQLISDVPLGFFLSGGIDSSIIVAIATQYCINLNTYSIGFDIEDHNETKYSRQIA